jgi:IS30 family transposase
LFQKSDLPIGIFPSSSRTKGDAMKYRQVTERERYLLAYMKNSGRNVFQIAFALERHRSTIYRELKRNRRADLSYGVERACEMARARRHKSRRNSHFDKKQWNMVLHKLTKEQWAPEQISLKFREQGLLKISWETIYTRIWKDKREGGQLYKHLRQVSKKRRKRYRAYDSRGVLAGKRHISERPKEAWDRSEYGHFEGDLVHGKWGKPCILTLVDRKTRLTIIAKLPNKTTRSVNRQLVRLIRKYRIKTITLDNGCEFHG